MDDIKPALTPDEWDSGFVVRGESEAFQLHFHKKPDLYVYTMDACGPDEDGANTDASFIPDAEGRHAIAAACLHDQPFGFTYADEWALMMVANSAETWAPEYVEQLRSLRARIAALLPPADPPQASPAP